MVAYRRSVVTFLDILGFREVVKHSGAADITRMLDAIAETAAAPGTDASSKTKILSFSDSVIRARPCTIEGSAEALLHEVQELAAAQWGLLEFGILVRGGITIGDISMSSGRAFGPAFVRAYELESSLAGTPRVILDPKTVRTMREYATSGTNPAERRKAISQFRSHLRLGGDGLWFVDYIASAATTLGDPAEHASAMGRYRNTIIKKANALPDDSPAFAKYLWLIKYHNEAASRAHPDNKGLKVRRTDVPLADELLMPARMVKAKPPIKLKNQTSAGTKVG